ncbi:MAG TPA: hypothetical protein PKL77_10595, partial [Candidatus Omnitrophota bacterium]|nr:hypothetical protein [Candidatus Omnitrophota bacterium]
DGSRTLSAALADDSRIGEIEYWHADRRYPFAREYVKVGRKILLDDSDNNRTFELPVKIINTRTGRDAGTISRDGDTITIETTDIETGEDLKQVITPSGRIETRQHKVTVNGRTFVDRSTDINFNAAGEETSRTTILFDENGETGRELSTEYTHEANDPAGWKTVSIVDGNDQLLRKETYDSIGTKRREVNGRHVSILDGKGDVALYFDVVDDAHLLWKVELGTPVTIGAAVGGFEKLPAETKADLRREGITADTLLQPSIVTSTYDGQWTDYRIPGDVLARKYLVKREGDFSISATFNNQGAATATYKIDNNYQIIAHYFTNPEKTMARDVFTPKIVNAYRELAVKRFGAPRDLWQDLQNNFDIKPETMLVSITEVPHLLAGENGHTRYLSDVTNRSTGIESKPATLYLIPNDPRGRDIAKIYSNKDTGINTWWFEGMSWLAKEPQLHTVSAPYGLLPGSFSVTCGGHLDEDKYFAGKEARRVFVDGHVEIQELNKYEVANSTMKRSEYNNRNGRLAIQEFKGIAHRFMNISPVTDGKAFIYYDLSVSYLKPIVAVNEKGHIVNLWLNSQYTYDEGTHVSSHGRDTFAQDETQTAYEIRPLTLPVEKAHFDEEFINVSGARSPELITQSVENIVYSKDLSRIPGYGDKQEYTYRDGELLNKRRVDLSQFAQVNTTVVLLLVGGLTLGLIIVSWVVTLIKNFFRGIRKLGPAGVTHETVDFKVNVAEGNIEDTLTALSDLLASFGFESSIVETARKQLLAMVREQVRSGISLEAVIAQEMTEFDAWRKAHGQSNASVYGLQHLALKELCYVNATKFKGSTFTFVPYLLDYAIWLLENRVPDVAVGTRIQSEETVWFEFIKKWSATDNNDVKAVLITTEDMNDLFNSDKFLVDYRTARDNGADVLATYLDSLRKNSREEGTISIVKKYGIFADSQGGVYAIKGILSFLKTHLSLFTSLLGTALIGLGAWFMYVVPQQMVNGIMVHTALWSSSFIGVGLALYALPFLVALAEYAFNTYRAIFHDRPFDFKEETFNLLFAVPSVKLIADYFRAFTRGGSDRSNAIMVTLHIGLTMGLWIIWHAFLIPHLAVPVMHIASGSFNAGEMLGLKNFTVLLSMFLFVYIPVYFFSKPTPGLVSKRMFSSFGLNADEVFAKLQEAKILAIGSNPKAGILPAFDEKKHTGQLEELFGADAKKIIRIWKYSYGFLAEGFDALRKGVIFLVPLMVVSAVCGFKWIFLGLFLTTFLLFVPLSYFSFYYQVQGLFGYFFGKVMGLGRFISTINFSSKLSRARARYFNTVPFDNTEANWNLVWGEIVNMLYCEDKISQEARDALKAGSFDRAGISEEAEQRIMYFLSSLFLDIPLAPAWGALPSMSKVFTSAGEGFAFRLAGNDASLGLNYTGHNTGYTKIGAMIEWFPLEWELFLKRLSAMFPNEPEVSAFVRNYALANAGPMTTINPETLPNRLTDTDSKSETLGMNFTELIEHWFNMRYIGVYRSTFGLIRVRRALELYARLSGVAEEGIKSEVGAKLQLVMNMQSYLSYDDLEKAKIERIMELHPYLELNYIGQNDSATANTSVLAVYDKNSRSIQVSNSVVWPGFGSVNPKNGSLDMRLHKISKWKCENQDNYVPFLRGEYVFFADGTADARLENALKMPNLLMEFRLDQKLKLMTTREYLFTEYNGWTAHCIAFADRTWSTISQRNLNMFGAEGFYGHSGIIPLSVIRDYAPLQGDYVSEDIALPMKFWGMGKGYKTKHIEYLEFGKARDVNFHGPAAAHFKYPAGSMEVWTGRVGHNFMGNRNVYSWQKYKTAMTFGFLNRKPLVFLTIVWYIVSVMLLGVSYNINIPHEVFFGLFAVYISQVITVPGILQEMLEKGSIRGLFNMFGMILPTIGAAIVAVIYKGAVIVLPFVSMNIGVVPCIAVLWAGWMIYSVFVLKGIKHNRGATGVLRGIIGLLPQLVIFFPAYVPLYAAGAVEGLRGKASFIRTARGWRLDRKNLVTDGDWAPFKKQVVVSMVLTAVIGMSTKLWLSFPVVYSSLFILSAVLWGLTPFITDMVGKRYFSRAVIGYAVTGIIGTAIMCALMMVHFTRDYLFAGALLPFFTYAFARSPDWISKIWPPQSNSSFQGKVSDVDIASYRQAVNDAQQRQQEAPAARILVRVNNEQVVRDAMALIGEDYVVELPQGLGTLRVIEWYNKKTMYLSVQTTRGPPDAFVDNDTIYLFLNEDDYNAATVATILVHEAVEVAVVTQNYEERLEAHKFAVKAHTAFAQQRLGALVYTESTVSNNDTSLSSMQEQAFYSRSSLKILAIAYRYLRFAIIPYLICATLAKPDLQYLFGGFLFEHEVMAAIIAVGLDLVLLVSLLCVSDTGKSLKNKVLRELSFFAYIIPFFYAVPEYLIANLDMRSPYDPIGIHTSVAFFVMLLSSIFYGWRSYTIYTGSAFRVDTSIFSQSSEDNDDQNYSNGSSFQGKVSDVDIASYRQAVNDAQQRQQEAPAARILVRVNNEQVVRDAMALIGEDYVVELPQGLGTLRVIEWYNKKTMYLSVQTTRGPPDAFVDNDTIYLFLNEDDYNAATVATILIHEAVEAASQERFAGSLTTEVRYAFHLAAVAAHEKFGAVVRTEASTIAGFGET